MTTRRVAPAVRWLVVIAGIVWLSAQASLRPPASHPSTVQTTINLMPEIFRTSQAAGPPVTTGCKGTPTPPGDSLKITLKSLAFKDAKGQNAKEVLPGAQTLDFAQNAGTTVGNFVSGAKLDPAVTYTKISITVGSTLSISCTVSCDAGAAPPRNGTHNWVTKQGNTQFTDADDVQENIGKGTSQVTLNNGVDTSFDKDLPKPISGGNQTVSLFFSNAAACELWDISNLFVGHAPKTDFKILPGSPSPNKVQ